MIWAPSRGAAWEVFQKSAGVVVVVVVMLMEEEEGELHYRLVVPFFVNAAEAVTRRQQIAAQASHV